MKIRDLPCLAPFVFITDSLLQRGCFGLYLKWTQKGQVEFEAATGFPPKHYYNADDDQHIDDKLEEAFESYTNPDKSQQAHRKALLKAHADWIQNIISDFKNQSVSGGNHSLEEVTNVRFGATYHPGDDNIEALFYWVLENPTCIHYLRTKILDAGFTNLSKQPLVTLQTRYDWY